MRYVVLLVSTLFTIIVMSDVHLAMAGDHSMRRVTGQKSRLEVVGQPMRSAWDQSLMPLAGNPITMGQLAHHSGDVLPTGPVSAPATRPDGQGSSPVSCISLRPSRRRRSLKAARSPTLKQPRVCHVVHWRMIEAAPRGERLSVESVRYPRIVYTDVNSLRPLCDFSDCGPGLCRDWLRASASRVPIDASNVSLFRLKERRRASARFYARQSVTH